MTMRYTIYKGNLTTKQLIRSFLCTVALLCIGITPSFAFASREKIKGFTVGQVIPGYNCLLVNYPPEAETNPRLLPPVFAAPTEGSRKLGTQPGIVFVVWPLNEVNGFVEMLRFDGERAWIMKKDTKPFMYPLYSHTPGRCDVIMTASGALGSKGISLTGPTKQ